MLSGRHPPAQDLYTFAGDIYQWYYRILTIPTIVLTAMTGVFSAVWPDVDACDETAAAATMAMLRRIMVSSLSALATVLVSVNSLLKYESTHIAFYQAAQQCDRLNNKIAFLNSYSVCQKLSLIHI